MERESLGEKGTHFFGTAGGFASSGFFLVPRMSCGLRFGT